MKQRAISYAAAVCTALVASACSSISTSTAVGPNGAHAWTQPGVLRISDISDPSTLNPMLTGADVAYEIASYALEYLVQLDDRGNLVPVLCERIPTLENGDISKDGLTITYHLRRHVHWSDGMPFTADDVIASWKQVMNPANNVQIREGYDVIERIDAPDPYTAVLHLKRPYAPLPSRFFAGVQEGPIAVMPAHVIAKLPEMNDVAYNSQPIGTGPFVVKSWQRNGKLIFEANPHYWRGAPKLKEIIFQAQPSDQTELIGFKTHELDADIDASIGLIPEYKTVTGMRTSVSRSLRLTVGIMNAQGVLGDVRLRHAIIYALDRRAMLEKIAHNAGYVADEYLPNWSWAHTADVPKYPYDPKLAAATLDSAGWRMGSDGYRYKNGSRLQIVLIGVAGSTASHNFNTVVQSYLRAVGIDAIIKEFSYAVVFNISGPIRQGRYDMATYSYSVNFDPAALNDDGCDQFAPAGANEERFCDPLVDRLERQAMATNDRAARLKLYRVIEKRRMEDLPAVPYYFRDRVSVFNEDLHGFRASRGIMANWNAWQWSLP